MLYANDAAVISQSSGHLRKMMVLIVTVFAAFDLTFSEIEGMPDTAAKFSIEAAGQGY